MGFESHHFTDESTGTPMGGQAFGPGFAIAFQNGPLGRGEDRKQPNGAFITDLIAVLIDRLEYHQTTRFASEENAKAIESLNEALDVLNERTRRREARGVEGTTQE